MTTKGADRREEVEQLLRLVVREPRRFPKLSIREQDLALRLTRRARLLGRLADSLEETGLLASLPATAIDQLAGAQVTVAARQRTSLWELDRIAWAVGPDASVPLVVMKGCAYLLLELPNARGRVFADVDLMTDEHRLEELEERLNAHGWQTASLSPYDDNYYRRWTHELPPLVHPVREVEVDLHHNVLPRTARLKPDGKKIMERSRSVEGSRYRVPADEDLVLHAMTHLYFSDDLADKLRELVDITDLLEHFASNDSGFWSRFVARASELDLERSAFYGIRYARELLGAEIPDEVLDAARRWAPPAVVAMVMDRLVPRALFPQHPDGVSRLTEFSRFLLYIRSHWVRMPPWLLVYHLAYKFLVTRLGIGRESPST